MATWKLDHYFRIWVEYDWNMITISQNEFQSGTVSVNTVSKALMESACKTRAIDISISQYTVSFKLQSASVNTSHSIFTTNANAVFVPVNSPVVVWKCTCNRVAFMIKMNLSYYMQGQITGLKCNTPRLFMASAFYKELIARIPKRATRMSTMF